MRLVLFVILVMCLSAWLSALPAAAFSQEEIDLAVDGDIDQGLIDYSHRPSVISRAAERLQTLASIARHQPAAASSDGVAVVEKWLAHVEHVVSGEDGAAKQVFYQNVVPTREPRCLGGGAIEGWEMPAFAYALALGRHTPVLWDALDQDIQERVAWLMRALAGAGHWSFDDENNAGATLDWGLLDDDGDVIRGHLNKGHGPNHQSGYPGVLIAAQIFFRDEQVGEHQGLDAVFAAFDHATWVAAFNAYGWRNVGTTWDRSLIQRWTMQGHDGSVDADVGVAAGLAGNLLTYYQVPAGEHFRWFAVLNDRTCYWNVSQVIPTRADIGGDPDFRHCSGNIPNPDPDEPASSDLVNRLTDRVPTPEHLRGERGMLKEFWIGDAKGLRSSLRYSAQGWRMELQHTAFAIEMGILDGNDPAITDALRRFYIATEDLAFKGRQGWQESSQTWSGDQYWQLEGLQAALYERIVAPHLPSERQPADVIVMAAGDADTITDPMRLEDGVLTVHASAGNHPAPPSLEATPAGGAEDGTPTRDAVGTASYLVDCAKTAPYYVWAEVQADNGSDSLFLGVENFGGEDSRYLGTRIVDFPMALASEWTWQRAPLPLMLRAAESNRVLLSWCEGGVRVRQLLFTDDPERTPATGTWTPGNGLVEIDTVTATSSTERAGKTIDGWHRQRYAEAWGGGDEDEGQHITWILAEPSAVHGIGLASNQDNDKQLTISVRRAGENTFQTVLTGVIMPGIANAPDAFRDLHFTPLENIEAVRVTADDRYLLINEVRIYGADAAPQPLVGNQRAVRWQVTTGPTRGWLRQDEDMLYESESASDVHRVEAIDPAVPVRLGCRADGLASIQ